ncbi:hypothetical protein BKA80DRAFT_260090, partial [Phyllosticta citrichinensis]
MVAERLTRRRIHRKGPKQTTRYHKVVAAASHHNYPFQRYVYAATIPPGSIHDFCSEGRKKRKKEPLGTKHYRFHPQYFDKGVEREGKAANPLSHAESSAEWYTATACDCRGLNGSADGQSRKTSSHDFVDSHACPVGHSSSGRDDRPSCRGGRARGGEVGSRDGDVGLVVHAPANHTTSRTAAHGARACTGASLTRGLEDS